MLCQLHTEHVRRITFRVGPARASIQGFSINKKMFFIWVCFGRGGIPSCSDWHKIVRLFPLHCMNFLQLCRTPHTAALAAASQDTSRAAVHVEPSDTTR